MAVVTLTNARRHVWAGDVDPRYPIAMWFAQTVLLGDGSGGTNSITIQLAIAAADVVDANLFSVEVVDLLSSAEAAVAGVIRSTNLADIGMNVGVLISASDAGVGVASMRNDGGRIRRFLGHMGQPGLATGIVLITPNVTGVQITFEAQGYVWGSRSRSIPGGPKYPPGALLL